MTPPRQPRIVESLTVCALLWMLAAALAWKAGAFSVEFGSHPDESAHYVTGLMIRDYIASRHWTAPLPYAEHYYAHYPKVALGMWPPFFHFIEAVWMLIFSPAKLSVLLLMALITAATGASIYRVLRPEYPPLVALAAGIFYVLLPLVQASTSAVMADGLVALLDFWAMVHLIRYLAKERARDALLFGVFAALSLATKANGIALVLLAPVALLITRRFHLLRARALYYAAAIMVLFGGPWQVLSYRLIQRSMGIPQTGVGAAWQSALYYVRVIVGALGWGLAPFCLLGITVFFAGIRKQKDYLPAGALALLLSVWAYHSLLGNGEPRYILAALPPALLLAVSGFMWTVRHIPLPAPVPARAALAAALAAVLFFALTWTVPRKPYQGFDQPAHFLLTTSAFADGDFLVVSDALGEGAFVSEVAMHDDRPGHVILRSTKVLSSSTWYGSIYHLRYKDAAELRQFLDQAPIDAVLLDRRTQWQDEAVLQQKVAAVLASDTHWTLLAHFPQLSQQPPWIDLYRRVGPQPSGHVSLDLRYTLGKEIVHTNCKRAGPH